MTRLFLRFYFGVTVILIVALMILVYVYNTRTTEKNIRTIELAFGGPARHIRDDLLGLPKEEAEQRFSEIESKYDFPLRIVNASERPMPYAMQKRLQAGTPVLLYGMIETDLPNTGLLLELGPLPAFQRPSSTEQLLGFGAIFLVAAAAIAILLRPVARQLRAVEKAATAIAAGDLSTRIKPKRWRRQLPLETAFNSMAERTESLVDSQQQLLQAVSHELRTPLARIRFAIDLIETSGSDAERKQRLAAVDNATQELDDLVGELLTYARLESETSNDDRELIDVPAMIEELLAARAPMFPSIKFSLTPESESLDVLADRSSLARAIGNLLSNAGRYADSQVVLSATCQNGQLSICVDDDGPGIPEGDRQRVFQPFVRLQDSVTEGSVTHGSVTHGTVTHGTGLGLALVHRIATGHGGDVVVSESPQGGARFHLTIPVG